MTPRVRTFILGVIFLVAGCATFSPPINGKFGGELLKNTNAEKVSILFVFKHYDQTKGIDAVPKLTSPQRNFNDIIRNALNEISNIDKYKLITINVAWQNLVNIFTSSR